MLTTLEIKSELKQKQRTITDLIRFISIRNDENPNYTLLLGAGCSITSGIRSGGQLINLWREEIYTDLINKDEKSTDKLPYSSEGAVNYLSKKEGGWYNKDNEYSSLFEKKYDLPRQRRMFVEREVSDKTPSIGYAYLIKLIEANYFNTLFTTNFDDLINEAFYQFTDLRPISCAHDSSINSITVSSKRPKIIKLHGDYLFDDIKSTLRETESLEDNIRKKFIEFSKDFGLIVVGYSGNDRSIMDVLNYLLKHEDYFKNGIYWCVRKGDIISEELRKLLWKERVYFIEIEGFDELFAEVNDKIHNSELPVSTNFISNKTQDIIHKFINNKYHSTTLSKIIKRDLSQLKKQIDRDNIYEMIKQIQSDDNKKLGKEKLENKEISSLLQIVSLVKREDYKNATKLINKELELTNSKSFKIDLYKELVNVYKRESKKEKIIKIIDILIDLEPKNPEHYIKKINHLTSQEKKLGILDKLINMNPYQESFYNKKAIILIDNYNKYAKNANDLKDEILKLFEKSIELNPSLENGIWILKFNFFLSELNNYNEPENIINLLSKQKAYSIPILEMKYELQNKKDELDLKLIDEIDDKKEIYLNENKIDYELLKIDVLSSLNEKDKINELFSEIESKELYKNDIKYLNKKAMIKSKNFSEFLDAIKIYKKVIQKKPTSSTINNILKLLIGINKIDEAKEIYNKYKYLLSENSILNIERNFLIEEKNFEKIIQNIDNKIKINGIKDEYIEDKAYYLIMNKNYQEAFDSLKEYLGDHNYCLSNIVIINYNLAMKRMNQNINKKKLGEIKDKTKNKLELAAICCLFDDYTNCYKHIQDALKENSTRRFVFKNWPVFDEIRGDTKFKNFYKFEDEIKL
jgi:tetratricopeptide (TPR) repeat protein